jgi:asparagine synthase (glutamine-hydrolysing)
MCGIFGVTAVIAKSEINSALLKLTHRGPDEQISYRTPYCSIAYSRLAIVNPNLPVHISVGCTNKLISFLNGEIYNYKKLYESLLKSGHKLSNEYTDSDLICHLYEEYGNYFPNHIEGMFSIVIHDIESKETKIFRDQIGIKPMYYTFKNGLLKFSSEINTLVQLNPIDYSINHNAQEDFFAFGYIPGPETIWKEIYHLDPGTGLTYQDGKIVFFKWFTKNLHIKNKIKEENKVKILEDLLTASILRQLDQVENGAILLSGGLDSSLIIALAHKAGYKNMQAFHLAFPDNIVDKKIDSNFARQISSEFKINLTEVILTPEDFFRHLDTVLDIFGQPFAGVLSTYFISKKISMNHKVCLTGDGADELFGSYKRIKNAAANYYRSGRNEAKLAQHLNSWLKQFYSDIFSSTKLFKNTDDFILRNTDFGLNRMSGNFSKKTPNYFDFSLLHDQKFLLPDQVLHFSDHLGMAHALEIRPPFLSNDLVSFAHNLNIEDLVSSTGETKYLVKKLGDKFFPTEFVHRRKDGFALPLEKWLKGYFGESWVRSKIDNNLLEDKINSKENFNFENVQEYVRDFYLGEHNDFYLVFKICVFLRFVEKLGKY